MPIARRLLSHFFRLLKKYLRNAWNFTTVYSLVIQRLYLFFFKCLGYVIIGYICSVISLVLYV